MAKTGLWLRGARGKFAGAVLQKGENGTILRDHVTPANPRSNGQMTVRMVFGVVSKAAAELADLVGISFQGVSSIKESKRLFRGENMSMLINDAKANSSSVTFAPKGYSVLVPNSYLVAKGTLINARFGDIGVVDQGTFEATWQQSNVDFELTPGKAYSAAELIQLIWGCQPGDQVTVVGIGTDNNVLAFYPDSYQRLEECIMKSARIVFKSEAELAQLPAFTLTYVPGTTEPGAIGTALQNYLVDVFATGKCNSQFFMEATIADHFHFDEYNAEDNVVLMHWNMSEDEAILKNFAHMLFQNARYCYALGYFRSHFKESSASWNFSRCQLLRRNPTYTPQSWREEELIYGVSYDVALASYVTDSRVNTRYTETGGSVNDINF